jgi:hypothetical protein
MNLIANQLRSPLKLLVVAVLLLMLPFIGTPPRATAIDEHSMHTEQRTTIDAGCAAACTQAANAQQPRAVLNENETRTPDPEPWKMVPYHQQFQTLYIPKKLAPSAAYSVLSARPPDIVKLSGHFLF